LWRRRKVGGEVLLEELQQPPADADAADGGIGRHASKLPGGLAKPGVEVDRRAPDDPADGGVDSGVMSRCRIGVAGEDRLAAGEPGAKDGLAEVNDLVDRGTPDKCEILRHVCSCRLNG
jgi:hypothetical protein